MSEIESTDIVLNDIKQGRRIDTRNAKMLCSRTGSEGIGKEKTGFNSVSLWRENDGGQLFFVQGSSDNSGKIYYRILTVEEYEQLADNIRYYPSAGVDRVGEFVLLCTPPSYKDRRADWYDEILGEGTHKLQS